MNWDIADYRLFYKSYTGDEYDVVDEISDDALRSYGRRLLNNTLWHSIAEQDDYPTLHNLVYNWRDEYSRKQRYMMVGIFSTAAKRSLWPQNPQSNTTSTYY